MTVSNIRNERGAILITMLLIVTVMSAVAVMVLDDIRFGVRRSVSAQSSDQARWYALGAEMLAVRVLGETLAANRERTSLDQPWNQQAGLFQVPGGIIDARLRDASNCFNLNSLVTRDDRTFTANEASQTLFTQLLTGLGVPEGEAEAVVNGITDWIDSDSQIAPRGAEDFDYLANVPPYRSANTLLSDITTLRAVETVTPDLLAFMRPFICALPSAKMQPLNINTLEGPEHALLLSLYLGEEVSAEDITLLLGQRPQAGGFATLDDLWAASALAGKNISDEARAMVSVRSGFFALNARVVYGETDILMSSLFEVNEEGGIRQIARQFGEEG